MMREKVTSAAGKRLRGVFSVSIFALASLSLTTCSLFKSGLGPKVDVTPPEVAITSPVPGAYVHGTVVLTGTASDDIGVTSLTASYPTAGGGTTEKPITLTGNQWTISLPSGVAGGLAEGKGTITVTAKAASGKASTASVLTYVDNTPPTVLVTTPTTYGATPPIYSTFVDISGQAYDASPISSVSVTLSYIDTPSGQARSVTQTANGANSWSVRFLLAGPLGSPNDGIPLSYSVTVTDLAGNASAYYYHSQDIYALLAAGKLFPTMEELGQLDQGGVSPSTPTGLTIAALLAHRLSNTQASRGNLKYSFSFIPTVQYSNLDPANPPANVLAPGSVIVGNVVPPANAGAVDPASLVFKIFLSSNFPAGTPEATLTAASPLGSQLVLTNLGSSQGFKVALKNSAGANLNPGQYVLDVTAAAQGSGTAHDDINFGIDSSAPTLTETNIGNTLALCNKPFLLSGFAASLSGLSTLLVEQSADGGQSWAAAFSKTYTGSPATDNWSTPAASLPNPGSDGSYTYRITLTTVSGLSAILYRSVIYDGTPPYINATAPAPGTWISTSSAALSGTAGDGSGSGVADVYYLVDSAANDHSAEIASWASSTGPGAPTGSWSQAGGIVSSWTGSAALPSEGFKRLWVVAVDLAGTRDSLGLVPAASLVVGKKYTIDTLGTTNFTAVGAASNTVGISFTATGAGTGTGVAWTGSGEAVPFGYDQNPPSLSETHGAATTFTAATAGSFLHFDGTLSDSDALAGLSVQYSKNGVPQSTVPITPAGAAWSWTLFASGIDVSGHTNDGTYTFAFTATDIAGKATTLSRTMTIDTQAPTVAVTSPTSNGWVPITSLSVTGSATDGTGSGVSSVYIKMDGLYVASSPTDHSAEDPTVPANGWTLATGQTSWSSSFTLSGEGRKTLWTKAEDAVGNVTTQAGAISSRVDFGLDLNPPTLAFTDSVGALVSAAFTLGGTTTDTNPAGAPTLAATVDGGASQAIPVVAGAWTFPVAVNTGTHANDGSHTYVITTTDVAGKTTTLSRTIIVDTTPPTITIAQPGSFTAAQSQYWLAGAAAPLGGSAADPGSVASGVAKVYFKVDSLGNSHASDSAATITGAWTLAAGSGTWSTTYSLASEGQFTFWTAAFDNAGNLSSIVSQNFGVDQNPPTLTETNHPATSATKAAFTLAGATGDTDALASLTITERKNLGPANAVTLTSVPASLSGATSATYTSQSLPIAGVADGSYGYVLVATDIAGKTTTVNRTVNIDTTPPTVNLTAIPAWVGSSAYTVSGTAADPNAGASGVASIQYQLDGGAWTNAVWTDTSGGANTSGTWSATLSSMTEGNHSIVVQATDAAANTTTLGATAFGVDVNPPAVTETALGTTSQVTKNAAFTMTGTVTDSNPVSVAGTTLTVSVSVNGGAATPAAIVGSTWSFTQLKVDGTYSYLITATDASGKTATLNRLALVDSTPPALSVVAPTPTPATWVSSTVLAIGGAANDGAGSGVKKTYYLVDSAATDHSAEIAAWNLTNGASAPSVAWAATAGLPGSWSGGTTLAGEGTKILWIVSADIAGNTTALSRVAAGSFSTGTVYTIAAIGTTDFTTIGASSNTVGLAFTATGPGAGTGSAWSGSGIAIPFGLDLNPPALSETTINTTVTQIRNTSVTFSGSASDTYALAAAHSLTVSVDGGAATDVSFTVAPGWSYSYSVNTVTHAQDGTHGFLFTATDAAGKTTTVARSIQVDTIPASAAVTSPGSAVWTGASPYAVTGTASDGAGAGVFQVWTIVDAAANSHATDTTAVITTGGAWKLATGTGNWATSWTLPPEGSKTLWVAVLDVAGNWTTTFTTVSFGYDATPPALTVVPMGGYRTTFSITGTVADAGSGVASLQYKIDSAAFTAITVAASWASAIPAAVFNALTEGAHTVTVQASDGAGNQSTQASTFSKDTTPPTLTYSNISAGGGTVDQDSNPVLSGTLADASGVASATYTLQAWNYSTQAWNTIAPGTSSLGSPAGASSWSWSLDVSATGLKLPDGKYQVAIGATDVPGNAIAAPLPVSFLLSRTNPGASFLAPSLGTFQNVAFPLAGTASDPNGLTQVRAKLATGTVDFSSGTSVAFPALPATVATGTPGVFTTPSIHGLSVGDQVYFWATPMPVAPAGSLQTGTVYYVQSVPTTTSFTISATSGGAAIAITTSTATNLVVAASKYTFSTFHPAVPVTVSGSTMSANNHQLANGDVVYFQGTTLPAPTDAATAYYVVNSAAGSFQVSTTSGGSVLPLSTAGTNVSVYSPTHAVSWLVPAISISGFSDGPVTAYVQAAAGSGKNSQTSRDFTLDTSAPTVALSSPSSGTRSVGNLTLVGTTNDGGSIPSGVTGTIQYQIGTGYNLTNPASWTSANVTGGSYSWTISLGDMSSYANASFATQCDASGNPATGTNLWKLPIVFQALDKAGNVAQMTSYFLILDPNGNVPVVTITQPATGLTFGGQQTITGTATQPVAIYGVEVAVDPTGGNNFPANPVSVSISGATVTAAAHPFTNGMMVFLTGATAPQILGTPVPSTTPYWVVNAAAGTFQVSASSGGGPVTFSFGGSGVSASVWAPATLTTTGNNVIWYYNINTTGAYPQNSAPSQTVSLQARAWNSPTVGGPKGTISGILTTPWVLTFNSSFPQVQNVQVNGQSYYSQITTAGTISFTATVSSSKGIAKIESVESSPLTGSTTMYNTASSYLTTAANNGLYWSSTVTPPVSQNNVTFANGNPYKVMITATGGSGALWTSAGAPASTPGTVFTPNNVTLNVSATGGSFIESDASGNFVYAVSMTIASTQLYSGVTGQYVFNIRATDMTSPVAAVTNQPVTLGEDNYYPTSTIASSATIVGSQYVAQGSAIDSGSGSGPISGFSKVIVYFVRAGSVLNIATGANGATSSITAKDMNNGGLIGTVTYPGAGAFLKLSIDSLSENNTLPTGGGTDANGDGFMESLTINGSSYTWMGQIDSTKIADGPVQLHYVVFDSAGNATHYVQSASVSNNAPVVNNVVIGTDVTGGGTINSTATFSGGYSTTSFTAVNKRLYFQLNTLKGNGALSYSLKNAGNEYWGTTGTTVVGNAITLNFTSISPSIADATGNGAQFVLTVTDSTPGAPQSASVTIGMNIQNTDLVAPVVTVNPLYWTDSSHNSVYQASSANGHLDLGSLKTAAYNPYAATAPYALPLGMADSDPKVSGAISFTGTVSDNQRLGKLTIQIGNGTTGYDFGSGVGVAFDVATWNGTNLVGIDQWAAKGWRLTITNEVLTNNGHSASWQLDWNSAKLNTVAGVNVSVSVKASDASSNVATPVASQVDVVPYISSLTTKITTLLSSDFARTSSGQYPVQYNSATPANAESFLVNGFNLSPTNLAAGATSDIRLSKLSPSGYNNNATPAKTGFGLAGSGVNATFTQLTTNVRQAALGNGFLTVITNGIPSINNVNDSSQPYNTETSATVASMTDARSLSLWDITLLRSLATYATGASFVSMAMNADTPQFAYSNNTYGYGINFFHNGATEQEIYENWNFMTYSALALNANGSRAALYDVNVASAGVNFYSDWGGIMLNTFYTPQASVWSSSSCYYRAYNLWLDNLHVPGNLATLDRYQYPDLAMIGLDANSTVFYSVYDQINDQVLFRTFHVGTNSASVGSVNNMQGPQATALYTNLTQLNQNATWPTFQNTNVNNGRFSGGGGGVATNNNSGNTPGAQVIATGAGPYTAVAATSGGSALLVYYQTASNQLVYSYNDTPTNSGTWSTPYALASLVGGNYVKIKVDGSNHVHIAYYDSFDGAVKYIYMPTYNTPSTNTQVTVDDYLTAGDKMSLSVDANGKPYISYKGIGNTAKVAWLAGAIGTLADGVNANKLLTGVWEVEVIPNAIVDSDSNRFQIGVGATTLRPVIGYTNNNTGAKGIEYLTRTADLTQ
jgi:hypothetical protein